MVGLHHQRQQAVLEERARREPPRPMMAALVEASDRLTLAAAAAQAARTERVSTARTAAFLWVGLAVLAITVRVVLAALVLRLAPLTQGRLELNTRRRVLMVAPLDLAAVAVET